jgi:hypothetical protein
MRLPAEGQAEPAVLLSLLAHFIFLTGAARRTPSYLLIAKKASRKSYQPEIKLPKGDEIRPF